MNQILLMQNSILPYAWGSYTAIAELTGSRSPSDQPQAELWMGAHPKAPSYVLYQHRWQPLDRVIGRFPMEVLGARVIEAFGPQLPFLFKVLAAGQPLSIQAHPNKIQAGNGYRRENKAGIALDAPQRNYKDEQHKPECICALTPFWGLCGFRPSSMIKTLCDPVWPKQHEKALKILESGSHANKLRDFFTYLMTLEHGTRSILVDRVVAKAIKIKANNIAYDWIVRLQDRYPNDIGVLSPLMLNMVHLQPGQALFLPAGQLHAYLDGCGIELMANSDNVLRGGLTPKHVDVPELIKILDFEPYVVEVLRPQNSGGMTQKYQSRAREFSLSTFASSVVNPFVSHNDSPGPVIILCVQGEAAISWPQCTDALAIKKGQSVFVPDSVKTYTLKGDAEFYKASVNI